MSFFHSRGVWWWDNPYLKNGLLEGWRGVIFSQETSEADILTKPGTGVHANFCGCEAFSQIGRPFGEVCGWFPSIGQWSMSIWLWLKSNLWDLWSCFTGEPGSRQLFCAAKMWQVVAPNPLESLLQLFGLFESSVKERGTVKLQTLGFFSKMKFCPYCWWLKSC